MDCATFANDANAEPALDWADVMLERVAISPAPGTRSMRGRPYTGSKAISTTRSAFFFRPILWRSPRRMETSQRERPRIWA